MVILLHTTNGIFSDKLYCSFAIFFFAFNFVFLFFALFVQLIIFEPWYHFAKHAFPFSI